MYVLILCEIFLVFFALCVFRIQIQRTEYKINEIQMNETKIVRNSYVKCT